MTFFEKVCRIQFIPKKIAELELNKDLVADVKAIRYDNIGAGKGSNRNSIESAMQKVVDIDNEIDALSMELEQLTVQVCEEIDNVICGEDANSVDMRIILKKKLLKNKNLKFIAIKVVHRDYGIVRKLYREGCAKLKIPHSISLNPTQSHLQE